MRVVFFSLLMDTEKHVSSLLTLYSMINQAEKRDRALSFR